MSRPPVIPQWLLGSVLHVHDRDIVLGDLEEAFAHIATRQGSAAAARWYWGQAFRSFVPLAGRHIHWCVVMLGNYLSLSLRHLRKHPGYAAVNIAGLAIGLTCFILIGLFVQFEWSSDRFHEKADRIYRIAKERPEGEAAGMRYSAVTPEPLAGALRETIPEIEQVTQLAGARMMLATSDGSFYADGIYATSSFFDVFSFPMLQGNPATALADPHAIVLGQSLARKLFGDRDALGQELTVYTLSDEEANDRLRVVVTAIIADVPANSHLTFEYILPPVASQELAQWFGDWRSNSYLTYASMIPGASLPALTDKLASLATAYPRVAGLDPEQREAIGIYYPQALTDIHLRSHISGEFGENGDIRYVYLFAAIAMAILLLACINYVNLATARSATRAREVGVRKVMGAHRRQLIGQFMSEAVVPALLAVALALMLAGLLMPAFNAVTGRAITFDLGVNGGLLVPIVLVGLGMSLLAGCYPAFVLSAYQPALVIKGIWKSGRSRFALRDMLVVAQFVVSIVLIVGAVVIQRQLAYVLHAGSGIDREQVLMIRVEDRTLHDDRYRALKQAFLGHAGVLGVTAAQSSPIDVDAASTLREWEGADGDRSIKVYRSIIQHDYLDVFGLELVEGRDVSLDNPIDAREGILINETLKRQLGWENAVGKALTFHGRTARVTGVVKDFNLHSFHEEIAPLALFLDEGWWFPFQRIFVKVRPEGIAETIASLEETMTEFSPSYPFAYTFLDDAYGAMYLTEIRMGRLFNMFSVLALLIACLGLLGLASFLVQQRTKEIGVRKVLGASLPNILSLLSKDFARLVAVACVIALPVAYLLQRRLLEDYAYQVSIGWGVFVLAGGGVLAMALLTVSVQSLRAALSDPVKSLRHE
ncbi:MAG: ABC transporter permease [Rhodothermales bacterium]